MKLRSWITTKGEHDGKEAEAGASGRDSSRGVHDPSAIEHEQDGHGTAGSGDAHCGYRERAPRHYRRHGAALCALFQKLSCFLDESPVALRPGSSGGRDRCQGCPGCAASGNGPGARGLRGRRVVPPAYRLARLHSRSTLNSHSGTKLSALANPSSTSLNSASSAFSVISVLNPSFPFSFDCQFSTSPSRKCFPCHTSENSPVSPTIATDPKTLVSKSCICHTSETPRGLLSTPAYLLMSSFASSRLSKGWRNGFVASGAALIACVISLAAVGKSPVFDEIRASARWLTQ